MYKGLTLGPVLGRSIMEGAQALSLAVTVRLDTLRSRSFKREIIDSNMKQ